MGTNEKPADAQAERVAALLCQASSDSIEACGVAFEDRSDDDDIQIVDDEPIHDDERDCRSAPGRRNWLRRRALQALLVAKNFWSRPASPWQAKRVPDEFWRRLGDEALGIEPPKAKPSPLDQIVASIEEEERLILSYPEEERDDIRRWFGSFHLLRDFTDAFEVQRDLWLDAQRVQWEAAYWRRASDESFGKKPWTGPSGKEGARR
jgi:hypothetical protein